MKALRKNFLCSNFKEHAILAKAFSFCLAFLQIDLTWASNVSLLSKWIPRSYLHCFGDSNFTNVNLNFLC